MAEYKSVFRSQLFAGQVAVVTGGGTGIGRCIAHELAHLGAKVVLLGRREAPLRQTVAEILTDGGSADWLPLNIRDEEAVDATVQEILARHGRIDALVNNAGGQFASDAASIRAKGWRAVIDTNLSGTFWMMQAVHKHWMASHGGAIVNIVADMWNGFPGMAHTGAARAGVVNLTMSLAVEWAQDGVRVNGVAPGFVLSSGLGNYPDYVQELAADVMSKNPSARLATEAEVASAVTFLLSPGAAYITGHTVRVDGGSSLVKTPLFPLSTTPKLPIYEGFHRASEIPERFR